MEVIHSVIHSDSKGSKMMSCEGFFKLLMQYGQRDIQREVPSRSADKLLTKKIEGLKNKAVQEKLQKKKEDAKSYFADFVRIMLAPEVGKEEVPQPI
eukprot:1302817-Amphidinium_carterae.4